MSTTQSTAVLPSILSGAPASTAHLVCDLKCDLGECCIFDDETNEVLFIDILGKRFHKLALESGKIVSYEFEKMICAFALTEKGKAGYLCAWEDGFQIYDFENNKPLSAMSEGEAVNPAGLPTRLNDGRCDRGGKNFICGGFYGDIEGMHVKVFKCTSTGGNKLEHTEFVDKIQVTNSLCFSPDGTTMYLADSPSQIISKYSYADGEISNREDFHKRTIGVPDGSCIDAEGFLWSAVWRSGAGPSFVVRLDPTSGEEVYRIKVPDNTSQVSCCCFGGPDLDVLFITTASVGLEGAEQQAGGLYAVKLPFRGLPEDRFITK
jgi:L-arabinonolactonase